MSASRTRSTYLMEHAVRVSLVGVSLDSLNGFLPGTLALQNQAVGNVVLVDVADVGHRFLADLLSRHVLHVVKPDVRIKSALRGFVAQLRDPAGAGVVGSEREQRLI